MTLNKIITVPAVLVLLVLVPQHVNAQTMEERKEALKNIEIPGLNKLIIDGMELMVDELAKEHPNTSTLPNREIALEIIESNISISDKEQMRQKYIEIVEANPKDLVSSIISLFG